MIKGVKGIDVAPAALEDLRLAHEKVESYETILYVEEKEVWCTWTKEIEFIDKIARSASEKILESISRDGTKEATTGDVVEASPLKAKL
ncbi:hypothetical protein MMC28_002965 [Mycoblastus sanguinarius]|nr:hypothetical protein [Mycoblastus sanguinarius]